MRIGVDISTLCSKWDGIGTYTLDVLRYILRTPSKDEYFLYADRKLATELELDERFHLRIDDGTNHLLWLLTKLPRYAKKDQLDVFWQPNFILPFRIKGMRNVVTVHDMSAYAYSQYASTKTNITHKLFLNRTCKAADLIMTDSDNAAEEITKFLPSAKGKVKTVYIGKKMFEKGLDATDEECAECLTHFGVCKNDYLLFVGTLSPRKNADVIVKGYLKYRERGGSKKLLLAGNIAAKSEYIRTVIAESEYCNDIVVAGYISEKEKRIFYYNASMLLFPSRLEGFGFPILEGMQSEIPVITSNYSCMPEIASDAAVYLNDIDSCDEMADRIYEVERMDADEKMAMIKRGVSRVQYFDEMNYPQCVLQELTAK